MTTGTSTAVCGKCGGENVTDRLIFCIPCILSLSKGDPKDITLTQFAEARDTLAAWLPRARAALVELEQAGDPRHGAALRRYEQRELTFLGLVHVLKEE